METVLNLSKTPVEPTPKSSVPESGETSKNLPKTAQQQQQLFYQMREIKHKLQQNIVSNVQANKKKRLQECPFSIHNLSSKQ